ncbi:Gram-negative bacterial tonB protein [compost metagenome]
MSISCFSQDWPSLEFINKNNYQEVVGDTSKLGPAPKLLKYAMYPNGKEGIYELIKDETKFPETRSKPKNGGKVLLKYVVNKLGGIEDIEVIISAGKPFDREAIRVLKKMERWIPGKLDNKEVRVMYTQPFSFQ